MSEKIDLAKYTLQKTEGSYCGFCRTVKVFLLAPRLDEAAKQYKKGKQQEPMYYLCAKCGTIAKAGVGRICGPEEGR